LGPLSREGQSRAEQEPGRAEQSRGRAEQSRAGAEQSRAEQSSEEPSRAKRGYRGEEEEVGDEF
jgi:hypothetical protein